jgi:hypothetical protein
MKVSTVLLPVKEKRFNPLTQREELMDTGMLQEYSAGKAIGQPIKAPSMAPVPQDRAIPSSAHYGHVGYAKASLYSPDSRSLAAHMARPGETTLAAAERLADSASRFEVKNGRATAVAGYLMGDH